MLLPREAVLRFLKNRRSCVHSLEEGISLAVRRALWTRIVDQLSQNGVQTLKLPPQTRNFAHHRSPDQSTQYRRDSGQPLLLGVLVISREYDKASYPPCEDYRQPSCQEPSSLQFEILKCLLDFVLLQMLPPLRLRPTARSS